MEIKALGSRIGLIMQNVDKPEYQGGSTLDDIDASLKHYSKHIADMILTNSKFTSFDKLKILDFGAGRGTLATLIDELTGTKPLCAELDPKLASILVGQGFETVRFPGASFAALCDLVYTSNVLEHIQNDQNTLDEIFKALKPGGVLSIYVPAFPVLFSNLDKNVGHYRRYTKRELRVKLEKAGFQVEKIHFVDSLGFFAFIILKVFRYEFQSGTKSILLMKVYDSILFPVSRALDSLGFRRIIGKNLFVSARKPLDHD